MSYKVNWTEKKKEEAIAKLTEYFEKYGHGESIHQNDDAQVNAIDLCSDIADDVLGDDGLEYIDE
jgi:hypothetical protein